MYNTCNTHVMHFLVFFSTFWLQGQCLMPHCSCSSASDAPYNRNMLYSFTFLYVLIIIGKCYSSSYHFEQYMTVSECILTCIWPISAVYFWLVNGWPRSNLYPAWPRSISLIQRDNTFKIGCRSTLQNLSYFPNSGTHYV